MDVRQINHSMVVFNGSMMFHLVVGSDSGGLWAYGDVVVTSSEEIQPESE